MKVTTRRFAAVLILLAASDGLYSASARLVAVSTPPAAVIEWSNIVRRAIVPAAPNGIVGSLNFGNKFPGEAAVYMGIVHTAIATTAHPVIVGLRPALGLTSAQQALVDDASTAGLALIPDNLQLVLTSMAF